MKFKTQDYFITIGLICASLFLLIMGSYIPAIGGVIILGRYLYKRDKKVKKK